MRSALTPNIDRLEIHPPVSIGPQWGQSNGPFLVVQDSGGCLPQPSWLNFFQQDDTRRMCGAGGRHRNQPPWPASKAQGTFQVQVDDNHKLQGGN